MKRIILALALALQVGPAWAAAPPNGITLQPPIELEALTKPAVDPAGLEAPVIEGPVIRSAEGVELHPLELIGEVRSKRKHWFSWPGKKHYIYICAENKYHYISAKRIPLVYDRRPWSKRHPYWFGSFELSKITAGGLITGAFTILSVRK
ncbi:hypothetical protein GC174_14780 [bacterium]|nr:hypothetical protein [bacterium]